MSQIATFQKLFKKVQYFRGTTDIKINIELGHSCKFENTV